MPGPSLALAPPAQIPTIDAINPYVRFLFRVVANSSTDEDAHRRLQTLEQLVMAIFRVQDRSLTARLDVLAAPP